MQCSLQICIGPVYCSQNRLTKQTLYRSASSVAAPSRIARDKRNFQEILDV
jgi:hypothetical protein